MPDDKKVIIDGIEMPLSQNAVIETGITDKTSSFSDVLWNTGGKSNDEILMETEALKTKIEQEHKSQEFDTVLSMGGKFLSGVINEVAASLEDTIAAFDIGDWRLPDATTNPEYSYYNTLFKFIDNTIGDGENEVGNYFSRQAATVRDFNAKVNNINMGAENTWLDTGDYVLNGTKNLLGSVLGFTLGGGAVSKTVRMATTSKWLNTLGNAALMTQAGSIGIAESVYDKVYRDKVFSANPLLEQQIKEAGEKAYQDAVANGGFLSEDPEMVRIKAEREALTTLMQENPELHTQAQEAAAKGADTAIKINSASFFLNLAAANRFLSGSIPSRNILSKPKAWGSPKDFVKEGLQESFEEAVIENVAEKAGIATGKGKDYGMSDAMKDVFSKEALESAVWGFLGGAGQTAVTERMTFEDRKTQYEKQQETINRQNEIGAAAGQPEVLSTLTSFSSSMKEISELAKQQKELSDAGLDVEANAIGDKILYNQAAHAFKTGTTANLIENYNKIATSKQAIPEVKAKALEAVKDISKLEKLYNDSTKYLNADSIYRNRANDFLLGKAKQELQNQIIESKLRAGEVIKTALDEGKVSLETKLTEQGERPGDITIRQGNLPYSIDALFDNKFEGEQKAVYSKFVNSLLDDNTGYESVRQLQELNNRLDNINREIASNEESYNKYVSRSYQRSLIAETRLAKSLSEMKPLLQEEAGSDNYEKIVDTVLDKYKGKILPERLTQFKNTFMSLNEKKKEELDKAQSDAIQKEAIEKGGKQTLTESQVKSTRKNPTAENISVEPDDKPLSTERQSKANNLYNVGSNATKKGGKKSNMETLYDEDLEAIKPEHIEEGLKAKGYFGVTREAFNKLSPDSQKAIRKQIKGIANQGWSFMDDEDGIAVYDDRTIEPVLNPTPTDDNGIEILEPLELADNINPEIDKQIKEQVADFYESLKSDNNDIAPNFEEFIRDYMKHSSKNDADKYFNVLVRGWEANGYAKADYKSVYNNIFRNRKDIATALSSLAQQVTGEEVVDTKEKLAKEVEETVVAIEQKQSNIPTFTAQNTQVYEYTGFTTHETRPKLAHLSVLNFETEEKTEDGIVIGHEYSENDLNEGQYVNSLKLLNPDAYLEGTKLQVTVPSNADEMLVPIHNEDGSKGEAIPFGKWVNRRLNDLQISRDEFEKTQEYKDKVPMVVVDSEGENVALIHDIGWYHPRRFMEVEKGQLADAVYNTRYIRQEVLKGNTEIVITEKRGGTYAPFVIPKITETDPVTGEEKLVENTIKIREANPQAIIAVANKKGQLVTLDRNGSTKVLKEGESFENTTEFKVGKTYDVRKTGNNTYTAFPVFQRKLKPEVQESVLMAIKVYLNQYNPNKDKKKISKEIAKKFELSTGLDLHNVMDFDRYIKRFIKLESGGDMEREDLHKKIVSNPNLPIGGVYLISQNGSIMFGIKGVKLGKEEYMALHPQTAKDENGEALMKYVLDTFAEKVLPNFLQNTNIAALSLSDVPLTLIDSKGNIKTAAVNYHEYLMDNLETNMRSANIGTKDNPLYVTKAQPVITFDLTNNPNRKTLDVKVPTSKVKETPTKSLVEKQVINAAPQKQLEEAVTKAEADNTFTFIGETPAEKVEDLKTWVNKEDPKSEDVKEFVETYVNPIAEVKEELAKPQEQVTENLTTLDEKVANLIKQAEEDLKWINEDSNFYDPFELTDEQVKQAIADIDRIDGIEPQHQYQLVDYIYNRVSSEVGIDYGSKVDSAELTDKIKAEIGLLINQTMSSYTERLSTIESVYNQYPERYPQLQSVIAKYKKAISKVETISSSMDILVKEAKRKLSKFTGIQEVKENEEEINPVNEDATEEVDENNEVEKNFSKTSLEENGKLSSSYRLKRFFSGIPNLDKNGNPITALLGVPTYVGFDSVFEVCQAQLADIPADFNLMIEKLEQSKTSHGWLPSVIEKLKSADKIIQNEFVSTMTKHSLNMEFLMYSFDRQKGEYSLKVFNTNGSAITQIIYNNWKNDLKQSPLTKVVQGNYEIDKEVAQNLLTQFEEFTEEPDKLAKKSVLSNQLAKYISKGEFTLSQPISDFNRGNKFSFYSNGNYVIESVKGKANTYIIKPYKPSLVTELVTRGSKASDKAKQEGIQVLSQWLQNFGINLSQGTWENLIEKGMFHSYDSSRSTFQQLFTTSLNNKTSGFFGILAGKLRNYTTSTNLNLDENDNFPLGDSAIEKDLVKLESRYTSNIVPNVFRDAGKAIFGFTPSKFITDRTQALKDSSNPLVENLRSLSFSSESLWLKLIQEEEGFANKFDISHLGLNAIKELGKKLYRDNDIVNLADADHELVKLGMFQTESGNVYTAINKGKPGEIKMRMGRVFSPTMSDKTTMTVLKSAVLDLERKHFTIKQDSVTANNEVLDVLFEQLVVPELKRITNFHSKIKKTNIKSYDDGAKMFLMLPSLNLLKTKAGNPLIKAMEQEPNVWNFETVVAEHKENFKSEISKYLEVLLNNKMKTWESNGYLVTDENGVETTKYLDAKYMEKFAQEEDVRNKVKLAAMDYIVNQLLANSNFFTAFIGDPAIYYKSKPSLDFVTQSKETFINVGKRLAAQIAPGNKIADSATNKYIQVFLGDNKTVSENIEYLTELLDDKKFDRAEWNRLQSLPAQTKEDKKAKNDAIDDFLGKYPNSADYFDIESTDAQEYTTWKEHLYILEKMGRTPDVAIDITPEEIREAREMFANNIPLEQFTEKQKAIYKKVLQPIKPVYTGQVYDKAQDVMRVVYIKTSSFPLLPQVTSGLELDKLRVAMESLEKESGANNNGTPMTVRASYQSGNKVGAMSTPLSIFKQTGGLKIEDFVEKDSENNYKLTSKGKEAFDISSLILDRDNFRIQQDVPFKSAKRNEDTVTLGTQTLKLLFGSGIINAKDFKYNGSTKTGKELADIYNNAYMELIKFKRDEFFEEIGVDVNGKPKNLEYTVKKLQSVLKKEAEGRGYPKQDIEALGVEHVKVNGKIVDVKFTLPLWLAANSNRYEALLNAIITNRVAKIKMPGNSYPVGSQEGFEFRNDFKDIDQNKIVFTSKWSGKLEAAKVDKKGNFISAQVIAPSKFRDNQGNLIDLFAKKDGEYLYVNKTDTGFRIKENMFSSDLFSLTSFRIPTSGHVSMAQVEIVGFLPYEVGDLMIVPKNFTKQKGLDFDIDKENTYQYWHTQDSNGKFVRTDSLYPLDEINSKLVSDPKNPLWKKLKVKAIQNSIVEVHKAVMTNPDRNIQKKINGILSIDFAKKQAEKIDGWIQGTKDDSYFTPLDDEYQKAKMGLGAAGKIGIGAYSIDVVFNSLAEQQAATGDPLQIVDVLEDGTIAPVSLTFDGYTSDGKMGQMETLDGERTIGQVMAEAQNIATDNEKEQVMGRVNLNSYTLDAHKVFNLLGFDKGKDGNSIPLMFLSQPILREYVKELSNASANIADFAPGKEEKIVNNLIAKYGFPDAKANEILNKYNSLFNNKKMASEIQAQNPDGEFQVAVLFKFLQLRDYGVALRALQGTLNVDSKGLGKSTYDAIERIAALERVGSNKAILNSQKLIGDFIEKRELNSKEKAELVEKGYVELPNYMLKPTTIVGAFSAYATNASQVWDKYLPYSSVEFTQVYDEILTAMGKSELAGSAAIEKKQHILKEMKKYLYSNPILFDGNPQVERARLFFDTENNTSLAAYLKGLFTSTEIPVIKRNKLINRFQYDLNKDGNISRIVFNNSQGENFDEEYLYNALLELAEKPVDLPDYNGGYYNSRMLARDLTLYSFLEGGVQEAVQFSKYIPIPLLKANGFTKAMQDIHDSIIKGRNNVFGKDPRRNEDNPHFVSRFTMQYAQHNPERFSKVDDSVMKQKGNMFSGKQKDIANLESFSVPDAYQNSKPTFLTYYNNKIKVGKKFQLYYLQGDRYVRVPVLGTFGMAEYNAKSNLYPSLIGLVKEIENEPVVKAKVIPETQPKAQPKVERVEYKKKTLSETIDEIANNQTEEFKDLSILAKALKPYLKNTTKFEIKTDLKARGKYEADTDTILIQEQWSQEASPSELARTVLKEYVHSLTANEILKYADAQGNLKVASVPQYITRLIRLFKEVESKLGQELKDLRAKDIKEGITAREKKVIYGGYNLLEFVEVIMTQPEFQQEMNSVKYAATNETLWERFVNIVNDILKAVGLNFDKEGITANAISSVFELIESEQNLEVSKEFSNFEDTEIDSQTEELLKETDEMLNPNKEVVVDKVSYFITPDKKLIDSNGNEINDQLIKNEVLVKLSQEKGTLKIATDFSDKDYPNGIKYAMLSDGRIIILTEVRTKVNENNEAVVFEIGEELEDPNQKIKNLFSTNNKAQVSQSNILSLRKQQIDYTDDQRTALEKIANFILNDENFFLLAGFAGTGKTTIAENIVAFAKENGFNQKVLAPTNKAAARLREKLGNTGLEVEAETIHKAMYGEPNAITGEYTGGKLQSKTVYFIDESSMITGKVLDDLESKLPSDSKIIFVGDGFQLEPVVGKDDRDPKLFENITDLFGDNYSQLSEVKRQEGDILAVATTMRITQEANIPNESTDDFIIETNKKSITEAFKEAIRNNEDAVFIVPVNKERIENNKIAREVKFGKNSEIIENGELVIGIANSPVLSNSENIKIERVIKQSPLTSVEINLGSLMYPDIQRVNFVLAEVEVIAYGLRIITQMLLSPDTTKPSIYTSQLALAAVENRPGTSLYGHLVTIDKKGKPVLQNVAVATYGYSITAHKSQGSEWDKVFVSPSWLARDWNHARWIYTAITRAKKKVHFLPSQYVQKMRMTTIEAIAKNKDYNSKPTQEDIDNSVIIETHDPLEIVNNLKSQGQIKEYCK